MRRILSFLATLFLSSQAIGEGLMFPPAPGAIDATHISLQPGVSEQDSYWVRSKYPEATTVDHYAQLLKDWRRCKTSQPGWTSFGNVSSSPPKFIHQQLHYWASTANNAFVMLALRYESSGSSYRSHPESDMLSVIVVRTRTPGAVKYLSELGVTCDNT